MSELQNINKKLKLTHYWVLLLVLSFMELIKSLLKFFFFKSNMVPPKDLTSSFLNLVILPLRLTTKQEARYDVIQWGYTTYIKFIPFVVFLFLFVLLDE